MRVLNIQAHPDDAECFCGGTMAKYAARGDEIVYLVCTKGNRGTFDRDIDMETLAATRRDEVRHAATLLGVKEVRFLDGEDGYLYPSLELRARIMRVIRQVRPDVVLTLDPYLPYEVHPDHRTVGMLAAEATVFCCFPHFHPEHLAEGIEPCFPRELLFYGTASPNHWEDVSEVLERKLEAFTAHRSQVRMAGTQVKAVTDDPRPADEIGLSLFRELALSRLVQAGAPAGMAAAESFKRFAVRAGHLDNWSETPA